jgi:hypothetical protein
VESCAVRRLRWVDVEVVEIRPKNSRTVSVCAAKTSKLARLDYLASFDYIT